MKLSRPMILTSVLASLLFAGPGALLAYTLLGGSLGIATSGNGYQRDVRVFNNFSDATANNNNTPDPMFPDALGAPLSIWKAAHAWASDNVDASKNFDYDWQGEAAGGGSVNENVVSENDPANICGGGVLAYTETPISDGWRISFCDNWTWSDGPGSPIGSQIDIQGVAAHELGHALGLDHAQNNFCSGSCSGRSTMCPSICSDGVSERDIETDDANGLQAIYGSKPGNKPLITSLSGSNMIGGTLIINGSNFASTVNVKFTAGTSQNTGTIPGVVYNVASSGGGTQVSVVIPATAQDGNVFVWQPGNSRLSNYFPIDVVNAPPPTINTITPGNVQAFQGGAVTILGDHFSSASKITVQGVDHTDFTFVDDQTITFSNYTPTNLGSAPVTVTTPSGTSNTGNFTFVETSPPKLSAPGFIFTGQNFVWNFGSGASDSYILIIGSGTTVDYKGTPLLYPYVEIFSGVLDANGLGNFSAVVPPGYSGVTFYSQIMTTGGGPLVLSNIVKSTIIF